MKRLRQTFECGVARLELTALLRGQQALAKLGLECGDPRMDIAQPRLRGIRELGARATHAPQHHSHEARLFLAECAPRIAFGDAAHAIKQACVLRHFVVEKAEKRAAKAISMSENPSTLQAAASAVNNA